MATRRVKTKNRGQAYTGPSYKMPPWMKKKRGGKRGRGGGRRGRGDRGGGRSGNHERKKKVPDAPSYLLEKKKKTDLQVANEIDEKPKVGLVDVSVKLPSQFRKDEIFELSMSKSNIETIVKLVSKLQQIADGDYIDHEEEKLNIAENSLDKIQPTGPPAPPPTHKSIQQIRAPETVPKAAEHPNTDKPKNVSQKQTKAASAHVDPVLLDYLTNHLQFGEAVATKALTLCMISTSTDIGKTEPPTSAERETLLQKVLDWLCLNVDKKELENAFILKRKKQKWRQDKMDKRMASGQARFYKITSNHSGIKLVKANWKLESRINHFCRYGYLRNKIETIIKSEVSLTSVFAKSNIEDDDGDDMEKDTIYSIIMPKLMTTFYEEAQLTEIKNIVENGISETADELKEMIEDEIMAIESIYGSSIVTRVDAVSSTVKDDSKEQLIENGFIVRGIKLFCLNFQAAWLGDLKDLCKKVGFSGQYNIEEDGNAEPDSSQNDIWCRCKVYVGLPEMYPALPPLITFYAGILPPQACAAISKYLICKVFPSHLGEPVLYNLVNELTVEMGAYEISRRILEERLPKLANPIKGTMRIEKNQYKKKNDIDTLNKMRRKGKTESDEAIQERLSKAKKSHIKILEARERERSRLEQIKQERAKTVLRDNEAKKKLEEENIRRKEKEQRAEVVLKSKTEKRDLRMQNLQRKGKQITLRNVMSEVNADRRRKKLGVDGEERLNSKVDTAPTKDKKTVAIYDMTANTQNAVKKLGLKFEPSPLLAGIVRTVESERKNSPWLYSTETKDEVAPSINKAISSSKALEDLSSSDFDPMIQQVSKVLLKEHLKIQKTSKYREMIQQRSKLPAYTMRKDIVDIILNNQVVVISGETGCGKTTQVPQIVLDWMIENKKGALCNMICTQPRRISAIGVADRIASERVERVGETVGYQIRLETRRSAKTRLLFCTTGVLLRRLQCDPELKGVSHIFVDEIHERDLSTDFLLIILRGLIKKRPNLHLVLMSATLNALMFAEYFATSDYGEPAPIVEIPGRAFPVKDYYLEDVLEVTGHKIEPQSDCAKKAERPQNTNKNARGGVNKQKERPVLNRKQLRQKFPELSNDTLRSLSIVDEEIINYDLIEELVIHIATTTAKGAILVFLPGLMEIQTLYEKLNLVAEENKLEVYPLHSSLSTVEQKAVFNHPKNGLRKVVVSTNIAETSITIDDVIYVIDSGKVKENRYDHEKNMAQLVETWVSLASAKQRRGRAGRVQPGICYHLFSSLTKGVLSEYTMPEMHRVPLHEMVLQIKVLDLLDGDAATFLSQAVTPPSETAVTTALETLRRLQAVDLDENDRLTPLGYHLATLPVDPCLGKILLYGSIFRILDPCLTIAASMSFRSPFFSPLDVREVADEKKRDFNVGKSDALTLLNAYDEWQKMRAKGSTAEWKFLRSNFLSRQTLLMISEMRQQFAELIIGIGFAKRAPKQRHKNNAGNRQRRRDRSKYDRYKIHPDYNKNVGNLHLYKAVLCSGLYPNIVVVHRPPKGQAVKEMSDLKLIGMNKEECSLHPCSVNFNDLDLKGFLMYHEKVETSKVYLRDCTTVKSYPLLLFGGKLTVWHKEKMITVDDWVAFRGDRKVAVLIRLLRDGLENIMRKKIMHPDEDVSKSGEEVLHSIGKLLETEGER